MEHQLRTECQVVTFYLKERQLFWERWEKEEHEQISVSKMLKMFFKTCVLDTIGNKVPVFQLLRFSVNNAKIFVLIYSMNISL